MFVSFLTSIRGLTLTKVYYKLSLFVDFKIVLLRPSKKLILLSATTRKESYDFEVQGKGGGLVLVLVLVRRMYSLKSRGRDSSAVHGEELP